MTELDRYQLLANAIAARPVPLLLSDRDAQPFTDGESITIPAKLLKDHERCWLSIVAQATLLAGRTLQPHLMRQLIGKRLAQQRYLALEALRARQAYGARLPIRFVEHPEWAASSPLSSSPERSLEIALSNSAALQPLSFFGELRPLAVLRRVVDVEGLGALRRLRQAKESKATSPQDSREGQGEDSSLLKLFASPWRSEALAKLLAGIFGASKSRADESHGAGEELAMTRVAAGPRSAGKAVPFEALVGSSAEEPPKATEYVYSEWNHAAQAYREDWVFAADAPAERTGGPRDLTRIRASGLSRELRRKLAALGLTYEMHGRQVEGIDLDLSPLIEAAIDHAAGYAVHAPRVYRAARRTRRDLSVCIVLDISGSTGEAETSNSSQFEQQLEVAWHLGAAFDQLGDLVEIFGFHSWGRSLVRWVPLKSHEERWSVAVEQRFAQLEPAGFTRLGAAIRHAHHRLAQAMRLPYRLMLVVTDGLPYDQDYEGEYARADVRKALADARADGVAALFICVGANTEPEKLHAVVDPGQLILIDEPPELGVTFLKRCRYVLYRNRISPLSRDPYATLAE